MMRRLIRSALGKLGYRLVPVKGLAAVAENYHSALHSLLTCLDSLFIVQVGANDGAIADPLHSFVAAIPGRTRLLLIEPQSELIPFIERNYAFHGRCTVLNTAIGPEGQLSLYTVDPKYWGKLNVPYAAGWPEYRAPTGVSSADRRHVIGWLEKYLDRSISPQVAVREVKVSSTPLLSILDHLQLGSDVDVLQIDAEGYDDQVIYHASIERTRPKLIHFEICNLGQTREKRLRDYLAGLGYSLMANGHDALAFHQAISGMSK